MQHRRVGAPLSRITARSLSQCIVQLYTARFTPFHRSIILKLHFWQVLVQCWCRYHSCIELAETLLPNGASRATAKPRLCCACTPSL